MITKYFDLETSTGNYTDGWVSGDYRVLNTGTTILKSLKFKFSVKDGYSKLSPVQLRIARGSSSNYIVDETISEPKTEYVWEPKEEILLNWMDYIAISLNANRNSSTIYYNKDAPMNSWISLCNSGGSNPVIGISCATEKYVNITDKNEGFPWTWNPTDDTQFVGYEPPKPLNSWKLDTNNRGYPWSWGFVEFPVGQNIFFKSETGIIPLIPYLKANNGITPISYVNNMRKI